MSFYRNLVIGGLSLIGLAGIGCSESSEQNYNPENAIAQVYSGDYKGSDIAMGEMDGDGIDDLLWTDARGNIFIQRGLGNGSFGNAEGPILRVYSGLYKGSSIAAGDTDGDGLDDILSTDAFGNIYVHRNLGNLRFEQ